MARNSFDLFMNGGHHEQHTDKVTTGQKKKRRNGAKPRAASEPVRAQCPAFVRNIEAVYKLPFGAGALLAPQYWRISAGRSLMSHNVHSSMSSIPRWPPESVPVPTPVTCLPQSVTVASSVCAQQLVPVLAPRPLSPVARVPGGGIVRVQRFGGGT